MPLVASSVANAFLLSVLLVLVLNRSARLVGLVDTPSGRKHHEGRIPLTGGLAICGAFMLSMLLCAWPLGVTWWFVAGLLLLLVVGIADDLWDLRAGPKLLAQTVAALVMVVPGGHVLTQLPSILGIGPEMWSLGGLAVPFTVVFVVGIINAYNMMDGLDGLAGGAAVSAFFWLIVAGGGIGSPDGLALLLLLSATAGFLVFNMRHPWRTRASVFMGDAGSMMLGASVAYFIVAESTAPLTPGSFVALLWLCAVPAIDTLSLIVRRMRAGRSPMSSDREHLHHILGEFGLSPAQVSTLIVAVCFVTGGIGALGAREGVPEGVMLLGLFGLAGVHTLIVANRSRWRSGRLAAAAVTAAAAAQGHLGESAPIGKQGT